MPRVSPLGSHRAAPTHGQLNLEKEGEAAEPLAMEEESTRASPEAPRVEAAGEQTGQHEVGLAQIGIEAPRANAAAALRFETISSQMRSPPVARIRAT